MYDNVCVVLKKKRGSKVYSIQLRIAFRSCGTNAKFV